MAVGTTAVVRSFIDFGKRKSKYCEKVTVSFVASSTDGSVPDTSIALSGRVTKIVTNPGSTAPTSNYDITLVDPDDSALDVLAGAIINRHTTTTEQVYPLIAGSPGTVSAVPVFLAGTYTLKLANNSVNSATGDIHFYLVDEL